MIYTLFSYFGKVIHCLDTSTQYFVCVGEDLKNVSTMTKDLNKTYNIKLLNRCHLPMTFIPSGLLC